MNQLEPRKFYIANTQKVSNQIFSVTDKFSKEIFSKVYCASKNDIDEAIKWSNKARTAGKNMSSANKRDTLLNLISLLEKRREELLEALIYEGGKLQRDAQIELDRFFYTMRVSSEEAVRIEGQYLNLDDNSKNHGYIGCYKKESLGPSLLITPFNFPLNLVAHKIGPAIAAGNPFILKPSPHTPCCAYILGEELSKLDLPKGFFSIFLCDISRVRYMTSCDQINLLSFTGSAQVGWDLKNIANKKKVLLELGGIAMCILDEAINLDFIAQRVVAGAYSQAGQSCISLQKLYINEKIYAQVKEEIINYIKKLKRAGPKDSEASMGVMISEEASEKLDILVKEATELGGDIIFGGNKDGNYYEPTLLENVSEQAKIAREEAFGPVLILYKYKDIANAVDFANATPFGLQASIFSSNLQKINLVVDRLEYGGVLINDIPTWRSDIMPYGGVKASGIGREGIRYAIDEYMTSKLIVENRNYNL